MADIAATSLSSQLALGVQALKLQLQSEAQVVPLVEEAAGNEAKTASSGPSTGTSSGRLVDVLV